jgi:3-methyladenine DNA glycosylase/8-oxoguanine DNA glycosylase
MLNPNVRLKAQMLEVAERWGGQRSLVIKYLFAYNKIIAENNQPITELLLIQ